MLSILCLVSLVMAEGPFTTTSPIEFQVTGENVITGYQRAIVLLNYEDPCLALYHSLMSSSD